MTTKNGTQRVGLYARVSTTDQEPLNQLGPLRDYARARGWEPTEFVDHGVSGTREKRPALDAMLAAVRARRLDAVVCVRLDRLARSTRHLLNMAGELETLGVDLIATEQAVDTTTPAGRLLFTVLGAIASFERDLIVDRVCAGLRRAKAQGKRLGRPPLHQIDVGQARGLLAQGSSLRAVSRALKAPYSSIRRALATAAMMLVASTSGCAPTPVRTTWKPASAPVYFAEAEQICLSRPAPERTDCIVVMMKPDWSLSEPFRTPEYLRLVDVFTILAPAAGIDPAMIRLIGEGRIRTVRAWSWGALANGLHYFGFSRGLWFTPDRCLVEGSISHELAHDELHHTGSPQQSKEEAADTEGQEILARAGRPRWEVRYTLEQVVAGGGIKAEHPLLSERIGRLEAVPADASRTCTGGGS